VVANYNTYLQSFPANMIAGMFGFKQAEFFQLDAAEAAAVREVPKVKF
jgi:LemA protein